MHNSDFEEYIKRLILKIITLEKAHEISEVQDQLEALAKLYADRTKKSFLTGRWGFNQHTRGVWVNHLMYNVHLLAGKIYYRVVVRSH